MKRFGFEEGEMARVLIFMARSQDQALGGRGDRAPGRVFECKTCSRVFTSFQALGGHRSSHKKPRLDADGGPPAKPRLHGCPICGVQFTIGQALGGHMRRHRAVAHGLVEKKAGDVDGRGNRRPWLDLNRLPCDDMDGERFRNAGELTPHQFSRSGPLAMDCVGY